MKIDKEKLKIGLWYTDENGNFVGRDFCGSGKPQKAVYAHACFPLEITENIYKLREDGGYGDKERVISSSTHLCRSSGKLAVAMVNSGDYDLYEALAVLSQSCERCVNVLWDKYLPGEDGYKEFSEEWKKANTVCDFCRDLDC